MNFTRLDFEISQSSAKRLWNAKHMAEHRPVRALGIRSRVLCHVYNAPYFGHIYLRKQPRGAVARAQAGAETVVEMIEAGAMVLMKLCAASNPALRAAIHATWLISAGRKHGQETTSTSRRRSRATPFRCRRSTSGRAITTTSTSATGQAVSWISAG